MGRNAETLKLDYPNSEWQSAFLDIVDLMDLLGDCVIDDQYVVSDSLNASIQLSAAGTIMRDRLVRKEEVNAKDAKMLCGLVLGHEELFVDVETTDVGSLESAVNEGIINRSLKFPFIFGRELYDEYAQQFEAEKDFLNNRDSIALLDALATGVYQYGKFVTGPYGLVKSLAGRSVSCNLRVPAYHCAKPACRAVHPVFLQTSLDAPINRDRDKIERVLRAKGSEPSEWWEFAIKLKGTTKSYYGDQSGPVILPLLGDAISLIELRLLIIRLLDHTKGAVRDQVQTFARVQNAENFVSELNRAQLLQICLVATEEQIAAALDALVAADAIHVPLGEVRRAVVNRGVKSGAFGLHAELGHSGVRFVSADRGLPLMRMRRLLSTLYKTSEQPEVAELEWQLREVSIEDLNERLDYFFHANDPSSALRKLVLARKINTITACHDVGLEDGSALSDDDLVEALLWKLGFQSSVSTDPHQTFWSSHERLVALAQSSNLGSADRFIEAATNYFRTLEGLLMDSLAFTSWALSIDHPSASVPFSYDDHDDRRLGLKVLQDAYDLRDPQQSHPINFLAELVSLRDGIEGFRILADHLDSLSTQRDQLGRDQEEVPDYVGQTELKDYVFASTVPFLDLSEPSRSRITGGLRSITETLLEAEVSSVRNDYAHYRRTAPEIDRIESALQAIHTIVTKIESLGFCLMLFAPSSVGRNAWGQSLHEFAGPRSYEHTFRRPTKYDWMGLPGLTEPQYLLRAASFGDPNEVLRFTRRFRSDFADMWTNFPKRRRANVGSSDPADPSIMEGHLEVRSG